MQPLQKLITNIIFPLNIYLFPYLVIGTYGLGVLETVIYPGFVRGIFFIQPTWVLMTAVISAFITFFAVYQKSLSHTGFTNLVLTLNRVAAPILLLLYIVLVVIEKHTYVNYVFSQYHIHIASLNTIVIFGLYILFIVVLFSKRLNFFKHIEHQELISRMSIQVLIFAVILLTQFFPVARTFVSVSTQMIYHVTLLIQDPNRSFAERSRIVIPNYQYYQFLKDHTPENAVIALPPQRNPWLTIGNSGIIRYFLYPRTFVQIGDITKIHEDAQYAVIASGDWEALDGKYGWPVATVSAKRAWIYDLTNHKIVSEHENFTFDLHKNPELRLQWGLLEL